MVRGWLRARLVRKRSAKRGTAFDDLPFQPGEVHPANAQGCQSRAAVRLSIEIVDAHPRQGGRLTESYLFVPPGQTKITAIGSLRLQLDGRVAKEGQNVALPSHSVPHMMHVS